MFPLRCIIEVVGHSECPKCCDRSGSEKTLLDTFAIINGETRLCQLVETVLSALGLQMFLENARGKIVVKNWKPLAFTQITDNLDAPVDSLLKDVSNHCSLVVFVKPSPDTALAFAQPQPHSVSSDEAFNNPHEEVSDDMKGPNIHMTNGTARPSPSPLKQSRKVPIAPATCKFHKFLERPKLERWFRENASPSRAKLMQYQQMLNSSNFRKHTSKITLQQVTNWFNNARSVHRNSLGKRVSPQNSTSVGPNAPSKVFGSNVRNTCLDFNALLGSSKLNESSDTDVCIESGQTMPLNLKAIHNESGVCSEDTKEENSTHVKERAAADMLFKCSPMSAQSHNEEQDEVGHEYSMDAGSMAPYLPKLGMNNNEISGHPDGSMSILLDCNKSPSEHSTWSEGSNAPMSIEKAQLVSCLEAVGSSSLLFSAQQTVACSVPCSTTSVNCQGSSPPATASAQPRTRLMFDPLSEIPLLEKWFQENPHPTWLQIDQLTATLNAMPYRQAYPPVTTYNVKIWFKNRRAKNKRLTGSLV